FLVAGADPMEILVWVNTWGTYGYMVAYALVAIACVVYTQRAGLRNGLVWVCATIAVVTMAYVFFANVFPVPAFPFNVIPYVFVVCVVAALSRYWYLKARRPEVIARIGNTETSAMDGVG
ncbi:MAG: amino acid permease, partial [Microbacterium sp.]